MGHLQLDYQYSLKKKEIWRRWLDPDKEIEKKLMVSSIRVDAFARITCRSERDIQIYDAVKKVWLDDDEGR